VASASSRPERTVSRRRVATGLVGVESGQLHIFFVKVPVSALWPTLARPRPGTPGLTELGEADRGSTLAALPESSPGTCIFFCLKYPFPPCGLPPPLVPGLA
jgi:hypothetical protein